MAFKLELWLLRLGLCLWGHGFLRFGLCFFCRLGVWLFFFLAKIVFRL